MSSTRLVQIIHPQHGRRAALVNGNELHLLSTYRSIYAFAQAALETGVKLRELLSTDLSGIVLDYDQVHSLGSGWMFLPSFDHPTDAARCVVSGCANPHGPVQGNAPRTPPWFYKGNGSHLRAHGEALTIPSYGVSGAEEAELVGVYVIGADGTPCRVGITPGNEFADAGLAAEDPRMLAHAKMRTCSIGPELVLDADFEDVQGSVRVERGGATLWSRELATGAKHTLFSIADVEDSLFQCDAHRIPGTAHVHYLGGSASSHADGIRLQNGDQVVVEWKDFGRPLRNLIEREVEGVLVETKVL